MSGKNGAGKGDKYRPIDQKKWEEGWEAAFGKKKSTKSGKMINKSKSELLLEIYQKNNG